MPRINIVNASLMTVLLSMMYFSSAAAAMVGNVVGIGEAGTPVSGGGMDGYGYTYSGALLGTSIAWAGSTFALGAAGTTNAVTGTTIALPAANDSTVKLLATAVNGNQVNQTFVVTYTDGTSASFTQSLSDWYTPQKYAGETQVSEMGYRLTASGATENGTLYLYGYSFAVNSAKTVKSITLPNNRNVVVVAVEGSSASTAASTALHGNVVGMVANGSAVPNGGMDGYGYAYSASLLGTSLSWEGSKFVLGAAGTANAMSSTTIALPAGKDSTVSLLATAVNGNQVNQTFVVTYTDGTSASFTRSLSDWYAPQKYAGETQVSQMGYRLTASGATDNRTFYLYGYSFATNNAKTVKSITLPNNRNVVVLAIDESTTATTPSVAAAPSLSPAPGTYSAAQSVTLSDSTPGAVIHYTTNGTTPTTSSAQYKAGTPLQIGSTTKIEAIAVASGYSNSAVIGATYTISSASSVPQTLKISGTPATTATVGEYYSFTPTVVASAGASLTYKIVNKPTWATYNATSGTLSGTPTASSVGLDRNIEIIVQSGTTQADLPKFEITVDPATADGPAGTASLSWAKPVKNTDGSTLTNLAGYVILYGTNAAALNSRISVNSPSTAMEIDSLSPGKWYFQVAAVNTAGVQSQFTPIVSTTVQ